MKPADKRRQQGERLRAAREAAGYRSARDAAIQNAWPESTYRAHETGFRTIGQDDAEKYARRFGSTTAQEILFGHSRPEPTYVPLEENDPNWRPQPDLDAGPGYSPDAYRPRLPGALPEIDVHLGAGEGHIGQMAITAGGVSSGHEVVAEWLLPESFIRSELRASSGRSLIMPVIGDSMVPTYQPGDRVVVDLAQNTLAADTVYVIDDRIGPPQIKRLQRVLFSTPIQVEVISDNPSHKAQTVELDRLRIIGRVCGVVARR